MFYLCLYLAIGFVPFVFAWVFSGAKLPAYYLLVVGFAAMLLWPVSLGTFFCQRMREDADNC